jgi:cobalt/nickel transport protein
MKYTLEIIVVVTIIIFAGIFVLQNAQIQKNLKPGEEAWSGSDSSAAKAIESSGYTPWMQPFWEPPSSEIATLLFCLQAALGSLVIGYFFGYYRGKADGARLK